MSRKKLSIMLALGCVKLVKEKKGKNIYLARSHIWAFFTKVGIHLKAFLMGHFKWCHINVMYGTLSPMIVPHKCCFIWLRHLSHLCISTTLKASGLGIIAIKLGLFIAKLFRCLKSLDRLVCHVVFIQFVQMIILFPYLDLFICLFNQLKILMKMSFEILDVAKWFQPSKIYLFASRQQFVLWYLFYFIYICNGSQKPIQMICLDISMTKIALIIPIRSSIMGNSLKYAKYYFIELLILILTIIFFIETLIIRGNLFIYSFS